MFCISQMHCSQEHIVPNSTSAYVIDCSCSLKSMFLYPQKCVGLDLLTLQNSKLCVIMQTLINVKLTEQKLCKMMSSNNLR